MKKDSYVLVVSKESKTPFLIKTTSVDEKNVNGILEKGRHLGTKSVSISHKDVVADLGLKPHPGKLYGVDTANLFRKTFEHDFWGQIHFFIAMNKEEINKLRKALDNTGNKLRKLGLDHYTENLYTEIRAKQGKWAGKYIHSGKEKVANKIWYAPEWAQGSIPTLEYCMYHEFGHVLRYNGLTSKVVRAQWQTLYQTTVMPIVIQQKEVKKILEYLRTEIESTELDLPQVLKNYVEENEDTDEAAVKIKAILRWLKQIHRVSIKELSVLWDTKKMKTLESLWPTSSVDTNKLSPLVTEYATVSVEELFAESFALYCTGKKLPAKVQELLEKSLSIIKQN
jgi:hypothetical protein